MYNSGSDLEAATGNWFSKSLCVLNRRNKDIFLAVANEQKNKHNRLSVYMGQIYGLLVRNINILIKNVR